MGAAQPGGTGGGRLHPAAALGGEIVRDYAGNPAALLALSACGTSAASSSDDAPAGVALTGLIYGNAFAGTPAAQQFFDALAEAVDQLQGPAPSFPANLALVAKAGGQSLSVLEAEPPSAFDPQLAPPVSLLDDMQDVFLSNQELSYSTPVPTSSYVDGTFSAQLG